MVYPGGIGDRAQSETVKTRNAPAGLVGDMDGILSLDHANGRLGNHHYILELSPSISLDRPHIKASLDPRSIIRS